MEKSMSIPERWKGFRELPPDIRTSLEQLIPLFEQEDVLLAFLFGSLSREHTGRDVDLAILTRDKPAFRLRRVIADCLGTERLDLIDLRCVSPVVRFEIVRTGLPLYVADDETLERYQLETLHLYRDTRPLRERQGRNLRRSMAQWSLGQRLSRSA